MHQFPVGPVIDRAIPGPILFSLRSFRVFPAHIHSDYGPAGGSRIQTGQHFPKAGAALVPVGPGMIRPQHVLVHGNIKWKAGITQPFPPAIPIPDKFC